jgi:hypothetical protein
VAERGPELGGREDELAARVSCVRCVSVSVAEGRPLCGVGGETRCVCERNKHAAVFVLCMRKGDR